jgi:hypothetical protein
LVAEKKQQQETLDIQVHFKPCQGHAIKIKQSAVFNRQSQIFISYTKKDW